MAGNIFGSNLFSSFNNNSAGFLGEYMSIRNGSYKKLLKAYYAKTNDNNSSSKSNRTNKYGNKIESSLSKEERLEYSEAKSDADALKSSADKLRATGKNSLFKQITKTEKDEKTGEEKEVKTYDRDAIVGAVKEFVDNYNKVIKSGSEPDSTLMLRRTMQLTSLTKANSSQLSRVGIKIGSNNQLSIDENTLKKANITTLKSLFQGTGSYAAEVSRKASDISSIAQQEIDSAKTYSKKGGYIPSYSSGTLFDSFF